MKYNSDGELLVSTSAGGTSGTTTGYTGTSAGANLKASSGIIYAITCVNLASENRFFQILNKNSNPSNGDSPLAGCSWPVYANNGLLIIDSEVFGRNGLFLPTGVAWGFSTTPTTYTAGTAANCIAIVRWA